MFWEGGRTYSPLRIERRDITEWPNVNYLFRLAQRTDWLWLRLDCPVTIHITKRNYADPFEAEKQELLQQLEGYLPDHRFRSFAFPEATPQGIYDLKDGPQAGYSCLEIRRPLTPEEVKEHQEILLEAIRSYTSLASLLMAQLAEEVGRDVAKFAATPYGSARHSVKRGRGRLRGTGPNDGVWDYAFHGADCWFGNARNRQQLEARLGYGESCGNNFGIIDPGFFLRFVNTTAEFAPVADLIRSWYDNSHTILQTLEDEGKMRYVRSRSDITRGWVLR